MSEAASRRNRCTCSDVFTIPLYVIINFTSENICRINFTCRNPPGLSNMDIKTTTPPPSNEHRISTASGKKSMHPSFIHPSPLGNTRKSTKPSAINTFSPKTKSAPLCKARNVLPVSPAVSESFDKLFAKNIQKPGAQAFSQHQTTSFILETQSQQKVEFGG